MASTKNNDCMLAVRGSSGLFVYRGLEKPIKILDRPQLPCRVMAFSKDGAYFAFCDNKNTFVYETSTGKELFTLPLARVTDFCYSPKNSVLCTWQPYVVYGVNTDGRLPDPNLGTYSMTGQPLSTFIQKSSQNWQPQWTSDESMWLRSAGSEILIHSSPLSTENKYTNKIVVQQMQHCALSPGQAPYHLAVWVPAHKGQNARVFLYTIEGKPVSNKTLMRADSVKFHWNDKGNAVLVVASTDVDATGKSYYGEQHLYLMMTDGESYRVTLEKQGPVYSIDWSPNSQSFTVVYGFMPAQATTFNLKGEVTFDMACGPRNDVKYNRFGNILLLSGFGNLSGNMELFSPKDKKMILKMQVPDTTQFHWAPDGKHFITATTTPRLRQDNNYRIWTYHGELVSEIHYEKPDELWEVSFSPASTSAAFTIDYPSKEVAATAGLRPSQHHATNKPTGAIATQSAYVPPHLRKGNKGVAATPQHPPTAKVQLTENQKKIRNLENKLKAITQLKQRQAAGQELETNQLEKISKEPEWLAEMEQLKLAD